MTRFQISVLTIVFGILASGCPGTSNVRPGKARAPKSDEAAPGSARAPGGSQGGASNLDPNSRGYQEVEEALESLESENENEAAESCPAGTEPNELGAAEQTFFSTLNRVRSQKGIRELKYNSDLQSEAYRHSLKMLKTGNFQHSSGTHDSENIFYSLSPNSCVDPERFAKEAMIAFMNSPGHRRNNLDPRMRSVGVGVASQTDRSGRCVTYLTVKFGRRLTGQTSLARGSCREISRSSKRISRERGTTRAPASRSRRARKASY